MSTSSSTPTNFLPHLSQLIRGTTLEDNVHVFVYSKCTSFSGSLVFTMMFQGNLLCPSIAIMLDFVLLVLFIPTTIITRCLPPTYWFWAILVRYLLYRRSPRDPKDNGRMFPLAFLDQNNSRRIRHLVDTFWVLVGYTLLGFL